MSGGTIRANTEESTSDAGVTVSVGTSSTAAQNISSYVGHYLTFQVHTGRVHLRFGGTDAATTDTFIDADSMPVRRILIRHASFKAIADSAGRTLFYWKSG